MKIKDLTWLEDIFNNINLKNLPHGVIITGPEGLGKKLLAKEIATKLLLNKNSNEVNIDLIDSENHPDLLIFDYLGHLCSKKLFEVNIEIFKSKIIVFGGGDFGNNIVKYLSFLGANVKVVCDESASLIDKLGGTKIGALSDSYLDINAIHGADALIITTYPNKIEVVGNKGIISIEDLKSQCPGVNIILMIPSP